MVAFYQRLGHDVFDWGWALFWVLGTGGVVVAGDWVLLLAVEFAEVFSGLLVCVVDMGAYVGIVVGSLRSLRTLRSLFKQEQFSP